MTSYLYESYVVSTLVYVQTRGIVIKQGILKMKKQEKKTKPHIINSSVLNYPALV